MKWEYKEIIMHTFDVNELNALGNEGWNLVTAVGSIFIFKRPIEKPKTQLNG